MDELKSANKPIPAITENGEFVEATLRNGQKAVLWSIDEARIYGKRCGIMSSWEANGSWQYDRSQHPWDIIDLHAVRERVERAQKMRAELNRRFPPVNDNPSRREYDPARKPSFAEALEQEALHRGRLDAALSWDTLAVWIESARAASGE